MATIAEIANKVSCGVNVLGTGTEALNSCLSFLEATSSLWITKRGFIYDSTKTLDEEYVQQLQQEKKLFILKDVLELTVNKEENPKETDELGRMAVIRDGLYAFSAKFRKGFEYTKALNSLNSFGSFDTSFVDNKGNILGTTSSDGSLKGFTLGMLDFDGITLGNNSNRMSQGLSFQFLYNDEIEESNFFISYTELSGYKAFKQDGVNQTVVSLTAPSDASTSVVAKVQLSNGKSVLTGLSLEEFQVTVNSVPVTPSGISEALGIYTFTVSALSTGDVVTVSLADTANNRSAIVFGGSVYQSNIDSKVVVA